MDRSRHPDSPATLLTIEARDLDTDARQRTVIHAVPPTHPSQQRTELTAAVEQLFPRARLRSFSDGAATFLDKQHLIVAFYGELPSSSARRATSERGEQQKSLFAA